MPEDLEAGGLFYKLIRLPDYEQALRRYRKLEPRLHQAVLASLAQDLEGGSLDEIPGTAGWVKGRVASPSRGIGKSGGFRVIYLVLRVQQDLYLQTAYDHRQKLDLSSEEKAALKQAAQAIKKASAKEA